MRFPGDRGTYCRHHRFDPGYQLFQAANNSAVMMDAGTDWRGVISGVLRLSRNLGLITGSSFMGTVIALAKGTNEIATAYPEAVATGMRIMFGHAAILIVVAFAVAVGSRALATGPSLPGDAP